MEKEVKHLKHVFTAFNGFPPWVVSEVISRVENEVSTTQINQSIVNPELSNVKQHKLILPYKGKKGEHTLRNVKHHIIKRLPEQEEVALAFTGTKLGTKFKIKGKTSKEHQHDLRYSAVYLDPNCNEEYNGEQPILAKKIYDIYKFQIFKKITIFHNILNIKRRLCLDCICHFQRANSQGYII